MSIIGFVPSPETAEEIVSWVRALAAPDEETLYMCLEAGSESSTERAVRAALEEGGAGEALVASIDDPMPVPFVLDRLRKRNTRLLVSGPFELPNVSGRRQSSD